MRPNIASSVLVLNLCAMGAYADTAVTSSATSYDQAYFEQFAPQNALDMVRNIPGFSIDRGDNRRGLGQGGANVLINGKRFSSKSSSIFDALSRISAQNVVEITLQDATALDIPGLTGKVAIVKTNVKGFSGNWEWAPVFRSHREPWWGNAEVTFSGKKGNLGYSVDISNFERRNQARGLEVVNNGAGDLTETRNENFQFDFDGFGIDVGLDYETNAGSLWNLKLHHGRPEFSFIEYSKRFPLNASPSLVVFDENEQETNFEISSEFEWQFGPGRMKIIGLYGEENSPYNSFNYTALDLEDNFIFEDGEKYSETTDEMEIIGRGEYTWSSTRGNDWQFSLEAARNKLERNGQEFEQIEDSLDFNPIQDDDGNDISQSEDLVEEYRYEIHGGFGRALTPKLQLQTSLGTEYSEITQSGEGSAQRDFIRPKGFASITYKLSETLDLQAKLEREVGQLNFSTFLSSTDLANGNDNAVNTDLVPEQSWNLELEANKSFGGYGNANFKVYGSKIEDVIVQIPLDPDGDGPLTDADEEGPGNIDSATAWGFEIDGTFKFDPLGVPGLKLDYEWEINDSQLTDPLTGEKREDGWERIASYDLFLQYDIPDTNWVVGALIEDERRGLGYRLNQILRNRPNRPFTGIFMEHKDVFGMKFTAAIRNLTNQKETFYREVYEEQRRTNPLKRTEFRSREYKPFLYVRFAGEF